MTPYLVEVLETITHMVTVVASDEQEAATLALSNLGSEVETLAPEYVCGTVRLLQPDINPIKPRNSTKEG